MDSQSPDNIIRPEIPSWRQQEYNNLLISISSTMLSSALPFDMITGFADELNLDRNKLMVMRDKVVASNLKDLKKQFKAAFPQHVWKTVLQDLYRCSVQPRELAANIAFQEILACKKTHTNESAAGSSPPGAPVKLLDD